METFNLNLIPSGTCPVCHVSQYDIGRQFRANLFEGSSVFTLDGTETVSVYVSKPDGNMVTESVTNTSSNYVVIETTEQMTACDGANLCELRIEKGGDRIGTLNFVMECEKSPDTGITSQTEINNLETLVDGFTALAVADQYDSANVIFDNVPTAGHGNGYAVTSEYFANETLTVDGITIQKVGNIVALSFGTSTYTTDSSGRIVIGGQTNIIPSGYRPSGTAVNFIETLTGNRMYINTAGVVTIPNAVSTSIGIRAYVIYFV